MGQRTGRDPLPTSTQGFEAVSQGPRLELLRQSRLLQYAVGGVSRQDLVIDREGCSAARGMPEVVIAFSMANEHASSQLQ